MSSTWKRGGKNRKSSSDGERRYTVRGVRREPVDVSKLSKALLGLVIAEAERQAQAEHTKRETEEVEPEVTAGGGTDPEAVRDA
jgi:hypothetical protein